jgi:transcriptional regulator with XRE-family HTH domain
MSDFGKNFKARMKERDISQQQMAEILNISQASVTHYVSGRRNPKKDLLEKIANELEVSLDWLCGRNGNQNATKDITKSSILNISCTPREKEAWVKAAGGQKLDAWVTNSLNSAAINTE